MNITIGNTSKKINSISKTFSGTSLSCRLKEPCSMQSPIFQVQGLTKGSLYNYCSFEGRYYWVDDIVYLTNNLQEVHCHLDPLATYADAIKNTYGYVTYGDSAHRSPAVDDTRFGPDFKYISASDRKGTIDIGLNTTDWSVIMTVNSCTSLAENGVLTYAMSYSTFVNLLNTFSGEIVADFQQFSINDLIDMLRNFMVKLFCGGGAAIDNIKSCIMVPVPLSSFSSSGVSTSSVGMGAYWVDNVSGVYVMNPNMVIKQPVKTIDLKRMLASSMCHWLRTPKYCTIKVTHPCGYLDINDPSLMEVNNAYAYATISPITGDYTVRFTSELGEDTDTIALVGGNVAVDIMGLINNTDGTVGGQLMKAEAQIATMAIGGAIASKSAAKSAATVLDVTDAEGAKIGEVKMPQTQVRQQSLSSGVEGVFNAGGLAPAHGSANISSGLVGICSLPNNGRVCYDIEYYYPAIFDGADASEYTDYCAKYGYPVNRYLKIGDVSGYCQCAGASVEGATGASEASKSTINSYLNNGIYIEN